MCTLKGLGEHRNVFQTTIVWHRNISHEDICYILSTQTIMLQNTVYKWFAGAEKRHVCLVHTKTTE